MKQLLFFLLCSASAFSQKQQAVLEQYRQAEKHLEAQEFHKAYQIYRIIEPQCDVQDTLYPYILWFYTVTATQLEKQEFAKTNWKSALEYALEVLPVIEKGALFFDDNYNARKYWMYKDVVVACFGLEKLEEARNYQYKLYKAYQEQTLPDGLDRYYNFEFFKLDGKNVWGYEFYPELGDPETTGSFSKIIYYVYSTHADGSDKDQLYTLHVLKFHQFDAKVDFDYVLTYRKEVENQYSSKTLYEYTYNRTLDYVKVMKDVREVVRANK